MAVTYRDGLTDSTRWADFTFRPGDIVISTPSKCGTTWMQMICALLIFQSVRLPAPLTSLSPWLDMRLRPMDEVTRRLEAQRHRRFIKTHTPLDGLPRIAGVHYVTVGRDARDVAVSMDHHRANLNTDVLKPPPTAADVPARPAELRERVMQWILDDRSPTATLNSLRAVVRHLAGAWHRRDEPAVTVLHYADLLADLEHQMRYLAVRLGITVAEPRWPVLVQAATFEQMRVRAADVVPDERLGLFTDNEAFFRSGTAGQWRRTLTGDDVAVYENRVRSLASPDFAAWLEHGAGTAATPGS